jgi:hypothetical protein
MLSFPAPAAHVSEHRVGFVKGQLERSAVWREVQPAVTVKQVGDGASVERDREPSALHFDAVVSWS